MINCPRELVCNCWVDSGNGNPRQLFDYNHDRITIMTIGGQWPTLMQSQLPGTKCFQNTECLQYSDESDEVDNCNLRRIFHNIDIITNFFLLPQEDEYTFHKIDFFITTINCKILNKDKLKSLDDEDKLESLDDCRPQALWSKKLQQVIIGNYDLTSVESSPDVFLDILAHEFCHGLIQKQLPDELESQDLEESLCDLFAVLVRNSNKTDISQWNWKIGQGFGENYGVLRDLSEPRTMRNFDRTEKADYHENSRIHSYAFYNFMQTKVSDNSYLFTPDIFQKLFFAIISQLNYEDKMEKSHEKMLSFLENQQNRIPQWNTMGKFIKSTFTSVFHPEGLD